MLDSDAEEYGGHKRLDHNVDFYTFDQCWDNRYHSLKVCAIFHCLCVYHLKYIRLCQHLSRIMRKPTISICKNKGANQLICAFVFAARIVPFLYFLNLKFPATCHLLCSYSSVCVGPIRKPHCWFSHEAAHLRLDMGCI